MAAIMTGAKGILAYFEPNLDTSVPPAFGTAGEFNRPLECAFAGLSAFASNSNHSPNHQSGAINWDAGIDLLFRIAGAR